MDELYTAADESVLTQTTGRRRTLPTIGAAVLALLASLGLTPDASARTRFRTRLVVSVNSAPLPVESGSTVNATAECGGDGKVLSCGFQADNTGEQLVNVFVLTVASNTARSSCQAFLRRTAGSGSVAGATIQATAICRV